MFCQNCGQQIRDDAKFCENCGALAPSQELSSPSQPVPPPPQAGFVPPSYTPPSNTPPFTQPVQQTNPQPGYQPGPGYQQPGYQPAPGYQQPGYQPAPGYPQQPYYYPNQPAVKKKSKALPVILVIVLVAALAIAAIIGIGGLLRKGKGITDVQMASAVDDSTYLPITLTDVFDPDIPVIYCTFLAKLPVGTDISTEWSYLGADPDSVSIDYTTQYSPEQNYFYLTMPDGGWPVGDYEVTFYVEGKKSTTVEFEVQGVYTGDSTIDSSLLPASDMILNVQTAAEIDAATLEPISPTNIFPTTVPAVYVTFMVNEAPVGSLVHLQWTYTETGESTTWDVTTTETSQNVQCSMSIPTAGWLPGEYEVLIFLNDVYMNCAYFYIE